MSLRGATILTVLALGALACSRQEPKAAGAATLPTREVTAASVVRSGSGGDLAVPAVVQARKRATLSARMPASVTELPYQEGQSVASGAVVVRVDDAAVHAAVAAAEAAVNAAEADLARTRTLVEKGAATPRELEQVTAAATGARAQLSASRDNLSYTALRAPFAGRIAARRVNLGDVVNPGMPLIEIEGQGGLEVRATVESAVATKLRPGSRLKAVVDGLEQPLDATVSAIAPSGDPTTHRFEVKADLPGAAGLRSGLFARLLVPGVGGEARILVPAEAVFERGGLTGVYVVSDGQARLRWVAVGARAGDSIEIRAGLDPAERVVLRPAELEDGNPVRVAATTEPTRPDAAGKR